MLLTQEMRTGVGRKRAKKEEKAKNKARGVIGSSRLGPYSGVLSEHNNPSTVFTDQKPPNSSKKLHSSK